MLFRASEAAIVSLTQAECTEMRTLERSNRFGRHDRLRIDGQSFRVVNKDCGNFLLQQVSEDILEDRFIVKSDKDINRLMRDGRMAYDEGYYSKTLGFLRQRSDTSDLSDLSEEDLRTIAWKTEWCIRFHRRRIDQTALWRPTKTPSDMRRFIESERDAMDRWYFDHYGERRKPGRKIPGELRKEFDYPAASTLRNWLSLYRKSGERMEAFRLRYSECGNRDQLPFAALGIITRRVERYKHNTKPRMSDIYEDVEFDVMTYNNSRPKHEHIKISATAVRRRIKKLNPLLLDAGREGIKRAIRKYAPVGLGLAVHVPMQRIEMDDWTMDLETLDLKRSAWLKLTDAQRNNLKTIRVTVTVAIDVATRCIVGFHISRNPPSNLTAKAALYSINTPKDALVKYARCDRDWPMYGRIGGLATDGGPAFNGDDFEYTLRQASVPRLMPHQDPRMRGTIESFFRNFKGVCRYFAGQTFANSVERGEYPSEAMASATFEATLKSAVKWIVDKYHNKGHRGLQGRTPYSEWKHLTKKKEGSGSGSEPESGLEPPLTKLRLATAFGYRDSRVIDKNGIESLALRYNDEVKLPLLHQPVGNKPVELYVDPHDLGNIYVLVDRDFRDHEELKLHMDGDFLVIGSVGDAGAGKTLEQHIVKRKRVIELAKKLQEAGKPFRLAAHKDLLEDGDRARIDAGLDIFALTQKQFKELSAALRSSAKAAYSTAYYPEDNDTNSGNTPPSPVVDLSQQHRASLQTKDIPSSATEGKSRPRRGRSTNTYGDDD